MYQELRKTSISDFRDQLKGKHSLGHVVRGSGERDEIVAYEEQDHATNRAATAYQ
jgi:hypothetical protein